MGGVMYSGNQLDECCGLPARGERLHGDRKMRRHQRDVFHSQLVEGAQFAGVMDLPVMNAVSLPNLRDVRLVSFSDAMRASCTDYDAFVDFFEDDFRVECFWNRPLRYLARLKRFAGVVAPDFSTCLDFPVALKGYNVYRNQALGYYLQQEGLLCIPNVRCEPDLPWMLDGIPRRSVVVVGARAAVKKPYDREALMRSVEFAVPELKPTGIIWYGSVSYGIEERLLSLGVPVHVCPGRVRG